MSIMVLAEKASSQSRSAVHLPNMANLFVVVSSIVLVLPIAVVAVSFLMGGATVSETLFLAFFAFLWNAPLLLSSVVVCAAFVTLRQLYQLFGHLDERFGRSRIPLLSNSKI